jgi:hypothetical protein
MIAGFSERQGLATFPTTFKQPTSGLKNVNTKGGRIDHSNQSVVHRSSAISGAKERF